MPRFSFSTWIPPVLLALALIVPCVLLTKTGGVWHTVALAGVTAGVVHGIIHGWMCWHQKRERQRLLEDLRLALGSQINSQLTLIQAAAALPEEETRIHAIQTASEAISSAVRHFSPATLEDWHAQHDEALHAARAHGLELKGCRP